MEIDLSPVGAAVARSLDMGKATGSIPVLGRFFRPKSPISLLHAWLDTSALMRAPRTRAFYFEKISFSPVAHQLLGVRQETAAVLLLKQEY